MTEQEIINKMKGLTELQVKLAQEKFGKNLLSPKKKENFFLKILEVLKEPMFLLLIVAAIIYFILGEPKDGVIMLVFVIGIISIDVIQEWKTDKTLKALKNLSEPHIKVIRNGEEKLINSEDLVPDDIMIISEGIKIPADGQILKANDLCVDESSLTGEADAVWKFISYEDNNDYWKKDYCYAGTLVTQGSGIILVDKIGAETEYGKVGINVIEAEDNPTVLQRQIGKLIKVCAGIAAVFCALVGGITYLNIQYQVLKERIIESVLSGITLAMAMIPEEFPVILTVFLSMGAWRLAKKKSLVRKLPSVETLGAISVLCVDKTGTITMNKMSVVDTWAFSEERKMCKIIRMSCETDPYDPMEKAMLSFCENKDVSKKYLFEGELFTEYSFTNELKMMGHVWKRKDGIIIAAKGSPEKIIKLCDISEETETIVYEKMYKMSSLGLRVIALGEMKVNSEEEVPNSLEKCTLQLVGLVGLADPPRDSIKHDIEKCINAGIRVVMITGDNGITASSIAKQVGIPQSDNIITGDDLSKMSDKELKEKVNGVSIFSRVIPEHKMRIVKAFKENGEIVAMTGDGVNDAAALKYADIGIAMGKKGSEVSREAADLILLDDNFSTIVDTVKDGRRIYDNIRKAVGYVFTIHIPVVFASLLAPIMGISSSLLFLLPVHVVLLELVIDPTCSIILERQLAEVDIMKRKPRNPKENILTFHILIKSIIQGLIIFATSFGAYYLYLQNTLDEGKVARTIGLAIIMVSNILLVHVNSSETWYAYNSFKNTIKDPVMWAITGGTIVGLIAIIYTPISDFLNLAPLTIKEFLMVIGISLASVMWYDIVKFIRSIKNNKS